MKFDSTGSFESELAPERIGVGVDLGNDHVYLGGIPGSAAPQPKSSTRRAARSARSAQAGG